MQSELSTSRVASPSSSTNDLTASATYGSSLPSAMSSTRRANLTSFSPCPTMQRSGATSSKTA